MVDVKRWVAHQKSDELLSDAIAGLVVAIMLIPQGMAYALLAGLPPQVGLYASTVPLVLYGLLGSSRVLAVGPVAMVSLLVASGLAPLAEVGSASYIQLALILALLVGLIQTGMGLARLGFLVNFLSHPVLSGFTNAAALLIGFSQVKHLLGIQIPNSENFPELLHLILTHLREANPLTLSLGLGGIVLLLFFKHTLASLLRGLRWPEGLIVPLARSGPLVVVLWGTLLVWFFRLDLAGVRVVGSVPMGLPPLTFPQLEGVPWLALLPTALTISLVGYMESISVAKVLASKRRQKIDANQELVALGVANLGTALTGGYPVTGGLSRSLVNFSAGARSGLASVFTALLIGLTLLFLTPLFFYLPNALLAAIILVAVAGLMELRVLRHAWQYHRADALSWLATFIAVLLIGIERGILLGVGVTILLYLWRTSRPHMAVIGRLGQSESYLNVLRHPVQTWPDTLLVRVDESLYFANTKFLEERLLGLVAERPAVKHLVLVGTAINFIDSSALETLDALLHELRDSGVELHLAAIKGPVMDRLQAVGFTAQVGAEHIHLTVHDAMVALSCEKSIL